MQLFIESLHKLPDEEQIRENLINSIKNSDVEFILKSIKLPKKYKPSYWIIKEKDKLLFGLEFKIEDRELHIRYKAVKTADNLRELLLIKESQRTSANKTYDVYYFYDGFGNFIQLKRSSEGNQQIVKNLFYDGFGRVAREQNSYFDVFSSNLSTPSTTVNSTNYTYDALGRVTFVRNPDGTNKTINFNHRTITAYDENGHRKAYVLDGYDRITNVLEYNNDPVLKLNYETDIYNTSYEYDTADNLVKITDALGNVFSFTYDSLGRRVDLSDPDLGNWTYKLGGFYEN